MPRKEDIKIGLGSCLQGARLFKGEREGQCGEETEPKHMWGSH